MFDRTILRSWPSGGVARLMIAGLVTVAMQRCAADYNHLYRSSELSPTGFIARSVTVDQLIGTLDYANETVQKMQRLEASITRSKINISQASTSYGLLLESLPNDHSKAQDRLGQIILKASIQLLNRYCVGHDGHTKEDCANEIRVVPLPESETRNRCIAASDSNTYRRLLEASYSDGLYHMGHSRPLPKSISDALYAASENDVVVSPQASNLRQNEEGVLDNRRNVGTVQWAQFIEHDLAKTVQQTMGNNVPIECCDRDFRAAAPRYRHPACAPLTVDATAANRQPAISCLSYVRSALGVDRECRFGAAQQLNQATNKLDLSQVYGVNEAITNRLRRFKNGELRAVKHLSPIDNSTIWTLPEAHASEALCLHNSTDTDKCYKSGDSRVNIDPYVTTLYTLFMRQHNKIAQQIRRIRRSWSDERVFQLARRINTALYRRIVFNEWAPVVIGRTIDEYVGSGDVDSSDLGVSNEYATAAARFYFSMMPGDLHLSRDCLTASNDIRKDASVMDKLSLKDEFYRPRNLAVGENMERIMSAMLHQDAMAMDTNYVDDVSKYRFRYSLDQEFGTDVLALDIQRGRDHGLAGYSKYVTLCSGVSIKEWADLENHFISTKVLNRLKAIYTNVDQIDLIVGGIAEIPMYGATVGPTFACIIDNALLSAKRASRLTDIWATTLPIYTGAQFVCDTTQLESVPRNIFNTPSDSNENSMVDCVHLPALELSAFIRSIA